MSDSNTLLARLRALFSRPKKTISATPYVGPGIEVTMIGRATSHIPVSLRGVKYEATLNLRNDPNTDSPISYKWIWVTPPPKGVSFKFEDTASYMVLVFEANAAVGVAEFVVVGTRQNGTTVSSRNIKVTTLKDYVGNEDA